MANTTMKLAYSQHLALSGVDLNCGSLVQAVRCAQEVRILPDCLDQVARHRDIVDAIVREGIPFYGITTGVGSQKDFVLPDSEIAAYNLRLANAHATRIPGPLLAPAVVRGALIIMINEFAQGHSGVSPQLLDTMIAACNESEMPQIDASGSVGASDLVPLAQMAVWLLNLDAAKAQGLPKAKETLSLINHNAVTLALGAFAVVDLKQQLALFDLVGAVTLEGFRGNIGAMSEAVNQVHKRPGQSASAARMRHYLKGSKLWSPDAARFIQDPLSFRALSQVHGAVSEAADRMETIWNQELNTVNDNPIIVPEISGAVSHANMDTTRLTLALDMMRQALGKLADLSGERIQKLQWPAFSGLPIGLAENDGAATGGVQFLNLGHIASSLITSMKIWARPHLLISVGQLADGVEDTSGHALHAVHDLQRQLDTGWKVAALEMSIAVWAIYRRKIPVDDLGQDVRRAYDLVRPLLPIGSEGEKPFDLAKVIEAVKALADQTCNSDPKYMTS